MFPVTRKMSNGNEISTYSAQPVTSDFTNVSLEPDQQKKKKVPRRLIHFSDGVLEEYSTDEDDDEPPPPPPVDPKTLTWGPWFWFYMSSAAFKTLGVADSCGEKLAWFFGITTPKYQAAIDEFYRLKAEEEKELEYEQRAREKMQEFSSIDVKVIDQARDKGSGDSQREKF
ncbi:protein FAM177A1-like isoform X2 [Mercenaria mercenaria]|uniref:protein FAM177A1-like isoform X2 n=1 Tax=Mercenaria mercenaria TaxID=6596 RepID=UPI00234F02D0|nr:protein FAM177A1-like isoform X2 [Mercenaria mercenaria]